MVKIPLKDVNLLISLITPLTLYAWITFLCALFGVFYAPLVWGSWIVITVALFYTKTLTLPKSSQSLGILLGLCLFVSISIAAITEPSVFGGRDQGSISDAAYLLQQNANILHTSPEATAFAEIYGAGQALNFPGFHYTVRGELYPQFPLPYIAFLAGFVALFGISGFLVANAILTFYFIFMTTTSVRILSHTKASWWFFTLLLSSFPILWFAKFTLSENLAASLVWITITLVLILRQDVKPLLITLTIATATLLFFTRIEGLWLAPALLYSLWKIPACKSFLLANTWNRIWIPSILLTVIGLTTLIMSTPFYKTVFDAILPNQIKDLLTTATPIGTSAAAQTNLSVFTDFTSFLVPVYLAYGLFFPLITTAFLILYIFHKRTHTSFIFLVSISAPLFLYYIDPQISSDHPWMLRRFVWILLPVTLGATVLAAFLWSQQNKKISKVSTQTTTTLTQSMKLFLVTLIVLNLFTTTKYLFYTPNSDLFEEIAILAQKFGPDDLILLSPEVTGDGWSMIDAPLRNYYDRNAVYFFNQNDYSNLDTNAFKNVFLVMPTSSSLNYNTLITDAQIVGTYTLQTNHLSKEIDQFNRLPIQEIRSVQNTIYQLK